MLSGSADATALVWSIPGLLSFSSASEDRKPHRIINEHRNGLTALTVGHGSFSANIAVSTDKDSKVAVWDYRTGEILRIILLQLPPSALILDPLDRALYASYVDGSVQIIDFFALVANKPVTPIFNTIHSRILGPTAALQPGSESIISAPSQNLGCAHSLTLSWDATTLMSGHESGKIAVWDIAHRMYTSLLSTLPGPVTNLTTLSPTGFAVKSKPPLLEINTIVKPKTSLGAPEPESNTLVPPEYIMSVRFPSTLSENNDASPIIQLFTQPGIPQAVLDQGFAELEDLRKVSNADSTKISEGRVHVGSEADFIPLHEEDNIVDDATKEIVTLEEKNRHLQAQLEALQRLQKVTFAQLTNRKSSDIAEGP